MGKKKGTPKKNRIHAVVSEFNEPTRITEVRFGGNSFELLSDNNVMIPKKVQYEISIEDADKRTVVSDLEYQTFDMGMIFDGIDYAIALDTNYCMSYAVAIGRVFEIMARDTDSLTVIDRGVLERSFRYDENDEESPELRALYSMILGLERGLLVKDGKTKKILIVIDHSLGEISLYNDRNRPLLKYDKDSFLPQNIRLMYASADKKNDSFFNQWIVECDKLAKKELNRIIGMKCN